MISTLLSIGFDDASPVTSETRSPYWLKIIRAPSGENDTNGSCRKSSNSGSGLKAGTTCWV